MDENAVNEYKKFHFNVATKMCELARFIDS